MLNSLVQRLLKRIKSLRFTAHASGLGPELIPGRESDLVCRVPCAVCVPTADDTSGTEDSEL